MSKPYTALLTSLLLGLSFGANAGDGACNHSKDNKANHVSLTEGSSRLIASAPTGAGTGDTYDNTGTDANTTDTGEMGGTGASGSTGSTDTGTSDTMSNDAAGTGAGTGTGTDTMDNNATGSGTSGADTTSGGM